MSIIQNPSNNGLPASISHELGGTLANLRGIEFLLFSQLDPIKSKGLKDTYMVLMVRLEAARKRVHSLESRLAAANSSVSNVPATEPEL